MSSLEVGIVGLPNAGKSTLFNALAARRLAETAPNLHLNEKEVKSPNKMREISREEIFLSRKDEYSALSPHELLERDIKTERLERIQIKDIVLEAGIVDEDHIRELTQSLAGPRGQISPITLRARDAGEGSTYYDIIDGFHRVEAMLGLGMDSAEAKVLYGCSDEELNDLRVLAASSVKSVQFVRLAKWMRASFQQSEWTERGLNLLQVFSLAVFDTSGRGLGLNPDEAESAKQWAKEKAQTWQIPIASVWGNLRGVEGAAPDLLAKVRVGGRLSPSRFRAIVIPLAGEWELQRLMAELASRYTLSQKDTAKLVNEIAGLGRERTAKEIIRLLRDPVKVFELIYPEELEQTGEAALQAKPDNSGERKRKSVWWGEIRRLSDKEKRILDLVFGERVNLNQSAAALGVSPDEFFNLFRRTMQKCIGYFYDRLRRPPRKRTK